MKDQLLVARIKSGDPDALTSLYETYRGEFLRWIMKDFSCPPDDSKDIFQVAILAVYQNIQTGKLDKLTSSLKTYLFGVGKNLAYEWLRKSQRNQPFDHEHFIQRLVVEGDPENDEQEEKLSLVARCLTKMGPPCQELLEYFYFLNKSMEEITTELGYKNSDTTKSQKYKCMGRLRKSFEEDFAKQLT